MSGPNETSDRRFPQTGDYRTNHYVNLWNADLMMETVGKGEFCVSNFRGQTAIYIPKDIVDVISHTAVMTTRNLTYGEEDYCWDLWICPKGAFGILTVPPSIQFDDDMGRYVYNDGKTVEFIELLKAQVNGKLLPLMDIKKRP